MDGHSSQHPENGRSTAMQKVTSFIPNDLEWHAQGLQCQPRTLNSMCEQIFKHGRITEIIRHTSQWRHPDGTGGINGQRSQALEVKCDHLPNITYVVHLIGFRVIEIIETITTDAVEPGA